MALAALRWAAAPPESTDTTHLCLRHEYCKQWVQRWMQQCAGFSCPFSIKSQVGGRSVASLTAGLTATTRAAERLRSHRRCAALNTLGLQLPQWLCFPHICVIAEAQASIMAEEGQTNRERHTRDAAQASLARKREERLRTFHYHSRKCGARIHTQCHANGT